MSDKNMPWCIHKLADMVGSPNCSTQDSLGCWVRAVPIPYYSSIPDRFVAAWWVITGRAYAVTWPEAGDLERALGTYEAKKVMKG
jgi:hypothetical protein